MYRRVTTTLIVFTCLATTAVFGQEAPPEAPEKAPVDAKADKKPNVDPSGTWKWEREFRDNVLRSTLILKKGEDGELSGTLQTLFGDGGPGREPVKIDDGKIDGERISFSVTRSFNDNEFTIDYEGKYADGKLGGTYTLDFGNGSRDFEWEAKRSVAPEALVGKWVLKFEGPNGNPIESSMTLTQDDKKALVGTYNSQFFGEAPLSEIKTKDGELSFVVVFDTDNGDFPISYTALPLGDSMKGTILTEFGGQENSTPFEAKLDKKQAESTDGA